MLLRFLYLVKFFLESLNKRKKFLNMIICFVNEVMGK